MKTLITVAALALGLAVPALAQDAKPVVTPPVRPPPSRPRRPRPPRPSRPSRQPTRPTPRQAPPCQRQGRQEGRPEGGRARRLRPSRPRPTPARAPRSRRRHQDHREALRDQEAVTGSAHSPASRRTAPAAPLPGPCCRQDSQAVGLAAKWLAPAYKRAAQAASINRNPSGGNTMLDSRPPPSRSGSLKTLRRARPGAHMRFA